ncbi:glycosyltransferase family 2 protein [Formosa sediminum]|uniref:Glycosyltransferase family 2 protein n=1 Tax=Formosa sediminum TaxID=2594004 RepID=A0A516GLZ4_9FLAO|nr:glycosyltransferase family A protein [Formosa sediminum]QDO92546.1 glycosyltransferase family 2 protein [Formosa sediminum]
MNTDVTVIIPLFNKEKHILKTITSVLNQSVTNFNVIIINDGSTDQSLNLINTIKDSRLQVVTITNSGVSFARNYGVKLAKTELIAFLDADDYWETDHLKTLLLLYKTYPTAGLFASGYFKQYFKRPRFKATYNTVSENYFGLIPDYFKASVIDSIAWTSAVLLPKSTFKEVGYFNETMRSGQDTELWIRIALHKPIAFSIKPTATKVINNTENHLSYSNYRANRIQLFDRFKAVEPNHQSLKTYLDLNRFSLAIDRKQKGDIINYKRLKSNINHKNLNTKQRILLNTPIIILKYLKKIQLFFLKKDIYLTPFK